MIRPGEDDRQNVAEAFLSRRFDEVRRDDFPADLLHTGYRFEPASFPSARGPAQDGPRFVGQVTNQFCLYRDKRFATLRCRFDVIVDQCFTMQLDRQIEHLADGGIREAEKQFVFQRPILPS